MVFISGSILVLRWILGHDFSGHYNRLALISVDIISGVYCRTFKSRLHCMLLPFVGLLSFMLERSPTLGSIQTSEYDKKIFASRSHEFNLKNATFRELFPDKTSESKSIVEARMNRSAGGDPANGPSSGDDPLRDPRRQLERNQETGGGAGEGFGRYAGAVTNVLVIGKTSFLSSVQTPQVKCGCQLLPAASAQVNA